MTSAVTVAVPVLGAHGEAAGAPLVLSARQGAVTVLTLNDPARRNALDMLILSALRAALDAALGDGVTRAVVLTGAGKGFCAGARLDGDVFESGAAVASLLTEGVNPVIARMRAAPVPIVTAVNGAAAGAGVGLALAAVWCMDRRPSSGQLLNNLSCLASSSGRRK